MQVRMNSHIPLNCIFQVDALRGSIAQRSWAPTKSPASRQVSSFWVVIAMTFNVKLAQRFVCSRKREGWGKRAWRVS